ncbi:CAP-associated domain-containing protein [Bacillus spongiae]|uniref:CAP-associated domain-containing protein n=1 Tax=Bacillus spongiae TaxID=2683610 RepID=A0ABU8HD73_9BACI
MKKIFLFILFITTAHFTKPYWEEPVQKWKSSAPVQDMVNSIRDNEQLSSFFQSIEQEFTALLENINQQGEGRERHSDESQKASEQDAPTLSIPTDHSFSIHNIGIGDSKTTVQQEVGPPKRSTINEYGVMWNTYHENYQNFLMVSFDENDTVNGLYTNQPLLSSSLDLSFENSKESIYQILGEPLTEIRKGFTIFELSGEGEYEVFLVDNTYVTIFYDLHENDSITAIQLISEELEMSKTKLYSPETDDLKIGFEYQLFDVTNAARVQHDLQPLVWDHTVKETARKHSLDMAVENYFDHTNLQGQSPFDRMEEDRIQFLVAGENLAYGHVSSLFAHEGLMNSLGHRENILQEDYTFLGIGVAFNDESQPYFTQKYYAN